MRKSEITHSTIAKASAACVSNFADDQIKDTLNLREQVDVGRIIVFQPRNTISNMLAAKAIKAKFFEAVFSRTNIE